MAKYTTPFDQAAALAKEHGWVIAKSVTKAVVVEGLMTKLRNVEVTLQRSSTVDDLLAGADVNTQLVGQGRSIPAAVRAALGLPDEEE